MLAEPLTVANFDEEIDTTLNDVFIRSLNVQCVPDAANLKALGNCFPKVEAKLP